MTMKPGGKQVKPTLLIAAAIVAFVGAVAIAVAATGGGDDDDSQTASVPPTLAAPRDPTATPSPTPEVETPLPVEPDGGPGTTPGQDPTAVPDTPTPTEPDSGAGPVTSNPDAPVAGPDTPIPSEPIFTVTPAPAQPSLPAGRYAEAAPIDGLDVSVAESFPPQYFLHVRAGLPSGCAKQYTHSFTRNGNQIDVEVLNSFPEGSPVCTAIYGMYEVNIALGSDFTSGETYTISVNDGAAETEFTAQ
jgi:hypothetical protein